MRRDLKALDALASSSSKCPSAKPTCAPLSLFVFIGDNTCIIIRVKAALGHKYQKGYDLPGWITCVNEAFRPSIEKQ